MATSPLVSDRELTESGQHPYAMLPLHRRFRFWLPLLGVIPPLLAASAGVFDFENTPGNLIVYGLYLAAEPFSYQQIIFLPLEVAFWYAVGVALDRRRFTKPCEAAWTAGWVWVLGACALFEVIRLATHEGSDFADQYLKYLLWDDPATALAKLPARMRLNYVFVSEAVPVLAAVPWVLVVIQVVGSLRSALIVGASPQRRSVFARLRMSALALTVLLIVVNAPESHAFRAALVFVPFLLLPVAKALAWTEWRHIRPYALSTVAALTCVALFRELALWFSQTEAAAKELAFQGGSSLAWAQIENAFVTARRLAGLLLAFSLAVCYREWLFPGFRISTPTPASLRSWLLRLKPVRYLALTIVAAIAWSIARQDTDWLERLGAYGALMLAVRVSVPTTSRYRWILYGGVLSLLWWYVAGSYEPERDLLLGAATFAVWYVARVFAERRGWRISQAVAALTFFFAVWIACSAGDALLPGLTPFPTVQPSSANRPSESRSRFQMLRPAYAGKHVGVALSGGGYRAAVVQAGALVALESLRIPITHIASVSGGSIIGAYYALGGDPYLFAQAVSFRQFNTTRDILDIQNASRLLLATPLPGTHLTLLPWYQFSRTEVQANALDRVLIHGSLFGGLPRGAPRLMLCTSDLVSGSALGITSSWTMTRFLLAPPGQDVFVDSHRPPQEPQIVSRPSTFELRPADQVQLSLLVSASGAFPLAFEPVPWWTPDGSFLMTDGGVSDNSAMTLLLEADRRAGLDPAEDGKPQGDPNWELNLAIAVDGGAMFQRSYGGFSSVDAGRRAMDIIPRLGATKPAEPRGEHSAVAPVAVWLSPSRYMDNSSPYDYGSIWRRSGMGGDVQYGEDSFANDLLQTDAFAVEEQQLFNRVASEIVQLDLPSLVTFLQNLVGVVQGYTEPLKRLQANWVSDRELRLLETHAHGNHIDASVLDTINQKRRQRIEALKLIAYRVAADLSNGLGAFVRTPTLKDSIDVLNATALFRLGQYLAFLKAADLRTALAGPTRDPSRNVTSAEQVNVRCTIEVLTKYAGVGDYAQNTELEDWARERQRRLPQVNAAFKACLERATTDPLLRADLAEVSPHTVSTSGHY